MNNNYYWSLIAASKKKLPPIWVEYIVARAGDFSLPAYDTMQENIVADTDHLASVQLYDSDNELVANLRPCLSTEKGHYLEGCLYDVVKKKFYYSQNAEVKYGDIVREVEYIESTGTQYIDTGIIPQSTEFYIDCKFIPKESSQINMILGTKRQTPLDAFLFNNQIIYLGGNNDCTYTPSSTVTNKTVVYNGKFSVNSPKRKLSGTIDGTSYNTETDTSPIDTSQVNQPVYIFKHGTVTGNDYTGSLKLYYLKLSDNGNIVFDGMPCILSDGTVCMWDWISGEAKKNAGTGEFVAGKDVNDLFNVVEKEGVFLNRTTGGGLNVKDKSLAHITSLKGNTLVWNQMVNNGDFKNGISGFRIENATIRITEEGVCVIQGKDAAHGGFLYVNFKYTDHKYYISTVCRSGETILANCGISFLNYFVIDGNPAAYNNYDTAFKKCSIVGYLKKNTVNQLALRVGNSSTAGKNALGIFKTFVCIDLTKIFGAGNEPATAEEFESMFPADYYDYDAGSLLNVAAGGMKSTNVEKTKWDSLYFVDDAHTLSSLTGKAEGSSVSDVIFPEGMKRIGNVYDELTDVKDGCFTKAVKRIGTRAYQAGDEADATLKTDGTNTYYTLSNAIVYTLDTPVPCNYKVWKGGTESIVPENTRALTAPVDMSVKYIVEDDE